MKHSFRLGMTRRWCHVEVFEGVKVHKDMVSFVEERIVPGSGVESADVWKGLGEVCSTMSAKNRELLDTRDALQAKIDTYHKERKGQPLNHAEYKEFLESIGYLVPRGGDFQIQTQNTDPELASVPGPQLVCPVDNARYIVNAANARWGSLLDALYGTDVVPGVIHSGNYDPVRGALVFDETHNILDKVFPLKGQSWADVTDISVAGGALNLTLENPAAFAGYNEKDGVTSSVLLKNNGLHMEICINRSHPVGKTHKAGVYDVQVEAALSVLADAEDSACTVDVADKIVAYKNWTGLMDQTVSIPIMKNGKSFHRKLNATKNFKTPAGGDIALSGKAVLMCRNVGLHMYTDIVKTNGNETPEHFLDAVMTILAGLHDVNNMRCNSKGGSIYLVKPKMHGPDEVKFVDEMFTKVEEALKIPKNTVKIGIMDEERRTSVNLREALRVAKDRVFFINTGFLDRVADEIHTSMEAGPMLPKEEIRHVEWMKAYEASNVDRGLENGLVGKGQIGKGMWAAPDNMAEMMEKKIGHLKQGATCSWCPSPTAATLHALHYHYSDVLSTQEELRAGVIDRNDSILKPPVLDRELSAEEIQAELDCNVQSLLGYVVRWVGLGVGCSKVPDTNDVQLMEDRATLRISSQHIANWLHHGLIAKDQVVETMKKMAYVVDKQNASDPMYPPMSPSFDTVEFHAAYDLIFQGTQSPNGYTEDILSSRRRERKALDNASSA